MAQYARLLPTILDSDAKWRAWAQGIHDAILACGLVQTDRTGQLDIAGATRGALNTTVGFLHYRFNDPLQDAYPIYFKVSLGVGGSLSQPRLEWAIYPAMTDVQPATGFWPGGAYNVSGADRWCYASGKMDAEGAYFTVAIGVPNVAGDPSNAYQESVGVSVSRHVDEDGLPTADGYGGISWANTLGDTRGVGPLAQASGMTTDSKLLVIPGTTSTRYSEDVGLLPIYPRQGKLLNPFPQVVGYPSGVLTWQQPVPARHYDRDLTVLPIGSACYHANFQPNNVYLAFAFE